MCITDYADGLLFFLFFQLKSSQIPRSKLTGHQTCNAAELRGIDPRGIRQMDVPHPLDSLLAGINIYKILLDSNLRILYTVEKEMGFLPSKIL